MAKPSKQSKRTIYFLATILTQVAILVIAYWAGREYRDVDQPLLINAFMIGVVAQLVDGALGMAYGATAATLLLSTGVPPVIATASIHIAEIFTTAASGLSHWHKGNINKKLFMSLLIPGTLGGIAGVLLAVNIDSAVLKPWMAAYLLLIGLYIIYKAFRIVRLKRAVRGKGIIPLALTGGFLDAVGGGGWGPVVTTTLLGSGHEPKTTIGSVNAAEFFITVVTGFSFALFLGLAQWEIPAGLIVGGVLTAPIAVHITSRLPTKTLMIFVGILISALSAMTIYKVVI